RARRWSSRYSGAVSATLCCGFGPRRSAMRRPLAPIERTIARGHQEPQETRNEFMIRCTKWKDNQGDKPSITHASLITPTHSNRRSPPRKRSALLPRLRHEPRKLWSHLGALALGARRLPLLTL